MAALRKINKLLIIFVLIVTISPDSLFRAFGKGDGPRDLVDFNRLPSHDIDGSDAKNYQNGESRKNDVKPKTNEVADRPPEYLNSNSKQAFVAGMKLADQLDCAEDVQKYCPHTGGGNMQVLQCLQNQPSETVSLKCQNVLWHYKKKLTENLSFEGAGKELCRNALSLIPECARLAEGQGLVVSCLIMNMDQITDTPCKGFLSKMQPIVFSDYQLIYNFSQVCDMDIRKHACGRLGGQQEKDGQQSRKLPHGEIISCLTEHAVDLDMGCRQEITRVAVLQADNFIKDRALYHACREDVERLCPNAERGGRDVYKCLNKHKHDPELSDECHAKLTARQKLQRVDYRVNRGMVTACRASVLQNGCLERTNMQDVGNYREAKLSRVIICLEAARNNGKYVAPECVAEMNEVRRSLMSDYRLTPEIVDNCTQEIQSCNQMSRRPNGQTLHCLMDLARGRQRQDVRSSMGNPCMKAMSKLLKEVNIKENIDLDPVIQEACSTAIQSKCSNHQTSNGRLMDCLMNYVDQPRVIHSDSMCKEKLMEIQYFISRDFTLSSRFYQTCHKELTTRPCGNNSTRELSQADQSSIILCLYRAGKHNQISGECMAETRRVMFERAKSVDLPADIEESCMKDLATLCTKNTNKNEEMDCLEDNLDTLKSEECKKAVERYIEEEEDEPELNEIILDECEPVINKYCKHADGSDENGDDELSDSLHLSDSLMQCLIRHKHDIEMNKKCRSQVTHHQIITLKDWHLSNDFKEACREDVEEHCNVKELRTKSAVVTCLSELIRNDTLVEATHRVQKKCRKQLKFELLQMSSNIQLDAELQKECNEDAQTLCSEFKPGHSSVINCLRNNQRKLSPKCYDVVFQRELREAKDPGTDFLLMNKCRRMILKYCNVGTEEIKTPAAVFNCLVKKKADDDFDPECGRIIVSRERTRAQDVRLNPELMTACGTDINKFCHTSMAEESSRAREGKVLYCLRRLFASQAMNPKSAGNTRLTENCSAHVKELVKESVLDYMQDRLLAEKCRQHIDDHCLRETLIDNNEMGDRGVVIDCLKKAFVQHNIQDEGCITEVARVSMESKTDVQVDPILHRLCSMDIQTSCKEIPPGEGRRMSCLLELNANPRVQLRPDCKKALQDRVQLWELAAQKSAPETLHEVFSDVARSSSRNYLLAVIFAFIGVLFIGGVFCGRVTKRVARQVKNR